jgi:hypothetical protein
LSEKQTPRFVGILSSYEVVERVVGVECCAPKAGVRGERLTLTKNMKGLAFWTKAKYGKMSIEGRDPVDTQTSHHSETRAIHDGKILVAPGSANIPSNLEVRQRNCLDCCYPAPQAFPKSLRSFVVKLVVKQRPCFDQNVMRSHQNGFFRFWKMRKNTRCVRDSLSCV